MRIHDTHVLLSPTPTDSVRAWSRLRVAALRVASVVLIVIGALSARAQSVEAVLYDTTMQPTPITMTALDRERIAYLDTTGQAHERALDEVLRLEFPVDPTKTEAWLDESLRLGYRRSVLELTDGQRCVSVLDHNALFFDPEVYEPDGQFFRWEYNLSYYHAEVQLDDIRLIQFDGGVDLPGAVGGDDVLVLANGEKLSGYTDAIDEAGIHFIVGDADEPVTFYFDRISALQVANPSQDDLTGGVWVTTALGSRILCRLDGETWFETNEVGFESNPGRDTLELCLGAHLDWDTTGEWEGRLGNKPGEPFDLTADTITRLDFNLGNHRLVPLSRMPMAIVDGSEVFGQAMPPRNEGSALMLHAPVAVRFDVPDGAERFVAEAALSLPNDVPAGRHAWASCDLVILSGGAELYRQTIDAEYPEHRVNIELPEGGELIVRLEAGANGPILDRVELRNAEVLVEVGR